MYILNIGNDIKFGVLDILRSIGMTIINLIYNTIDVLYDVAQKINGLNFIQMLENVDNSPFVKIFNAFFILAFSVLFLFAVWKLTFSILDGDAQDNSIYELVKEIIKCGILTFCVYLIFNTGINIGIGLSNAIYNNFTNGNSTIGSTMKTAYLGTSEKCFKVIGGEKVDEENVKSIKDNLMGYVPNNILDSLTTVKDLEKYIRTNKITADNVIDSETFALKCQVYKAGLWNDGEEYVFSYNYLFGIVIGSIFLFSIGFAVLMLGKRQLEIAFLMVISPLVFSTAVGRKEQRQALYQQFASLVLQAGALMLLIGLTAIMFTAIQNSQEINELNTFTKIVTQSILYLGCAMMLLTGSTALNRFIGENVSANSGRDMLMAMHGLAGGMMTAMGTGVAGIKMAKNTTVGGYKTGKGLGQLTKGGVKTAKGFMQGVASVHPNLNSRLSARMNENLGKGFDNIMKGSSMQESSNPITRAYGRHLESKGENSVNKIGEQWDFEHDKYNADYIKNGVGLAQQGIDNIRNGLGQTFRSNICNPRKNYKQPIINENKKQSEKI